MKRIRSRVVRRVIEVQFWKRKCQHCRESFEARRSDARYCAARCRVAAKRKRDRS